MDIFHGVTAFSLLLERSGVYYLHKIDKLRKTMRIN